MSILESLKINNYFSISGITLFYELFIYFCIMFAKYFKINSISNFFNKNDLISFTLLPTILIILVVIFVECNTVTTKDKILILIIKRAFLIGLLFIPTLKIDLKNYIIGSMFIFIYYIFSNLKNIYGCDVSTKQLGISYLTASLIYLIIKLIR